MSLILVPGLHTTFLLLSLPFLFQPLQVSCRGLTIESPTRNTCSTLGVSECWSWSADLLVSSILDLCGCGFAAGLGYVVGLLRGVGSSGCCGRGLANLLLLLVLEELLWASLPGSLGCFALTEGAGPSARTTVGGCWSTTVLGEGCGWVQLVLVDCDLLGWWRLVVFCVPVVGSVGHKWIPSADPGTTPLVPCYTRGQGLCVLGARA